MVPSRTRAGSGSASACGEPAESAVKVLRKGARIQVDGQLREESWEDEDGTERSALRLTASRIGIDPLCIESVTYRQRNGFSSEARSDDPGEE